MKKLLFTIILCLFGINAYPAQFLFKTVKPSGGDYTTLEACMNANEQDLTGDGWFDVEIDGDWSGGADTTAVAIHNYTTTSDDYVSITTATAARHLGVWSTSYYIHSWALRWNGDSGFGISSDNIYVDGIQISVDGGSSYNYASGICVGDDNRVSNCIIKGIDTLDHSYGIAKDNSILWNNIIYAFLGSESSGIMLTWGQVGTLTAYNNTCFGNSAGITTKEASSVILYNNLCNNNSNDYILNRHDTDADNIAGPTDTSSPDNEWDNTNVVFTNETGGSENLHIAVADSSGAKGGGTVDPGSGLFSDDIDGNTRGATWDIGADEYVSEAVTFIPKIWIY